MINASICYFDFACHSVTSLLSAIWFPEPARIGFYTPELDVYGSYFPAWLICLAAGLILTIGVRLIGVFNLGIVRMLGPLVAVSLILIFSISTWFLFFAN